MGCAWAGAEVGVVVVLVVLKQILRVALKKAKRSQAKPAGKGENFCKRWFYCHEFALKWQINVFPSEPDDFMLALFAISCDKCHDYRVPRQLCPSTHSLINWSFNGTFICVYSESSARTRCSASHADPWWWTVNGTDIICSPMVQPFNRYVIVRTAHARSPIDFTSRYSH